MAYNLSVGSTPRYVSGEFEYKLVGGDTLYYGDSPNVSASNKIGSLAVGDVISRSSPSYVVSAGTSYVDQRARSTPSSASVISPVDGGTPTYDLSSRSFVMRAGLGATNVKNYGATGNGTTDDTVAIQTAVNEVVADGGGTVFFPAGTYRVAGEITLDSGVTLQGQGEASIILCDDVAGSVVSCEGASAAPAGTVLTSDVDEGDTVIDVTNGALYSAGQQVRLQPTDINRGSFITTVLSVASNAVTLTQPSPYSFTVSGDAVKLAYYTDVPRDIRIDSLSFQNAATTPTLRKYFLSLEYFCDVTVSNCSFGGLGAASASAVYMGAGLRGVVRNCRATNIIGSASHAINFSYGSNAKVIENHVSNSATGISLSACPNSVVSGNTLTGYASVSGRAMKCLASSGSVFSGNTSQGFVATGCVYVLGSSRCTISDNTCLGGDSGIVISWTARNSTENTISGNTLRELTAHGIFLGAENITDVTRNVVVGNITNETGVGYGIAVESSYNMVANNIVLNWASPYIGIRAGTAAVGNVIVNNTGESSYTTAFIDTSLGLTNVVRDNYSATDTTTLDATDLSGIKSAVPNAISGSRGGNAALASLLTALAARGIITDGTSA